MDMSRVGTGLTMGQTHFEGVNLHVTDFTVRKTVECAPSDFCEENVHQTRPQKKNIAAYWL